MSKWTDEQADAHADQELNRLLRESIVNKYVIPDTPLTLADRCDKCGAAAQVRMHFPPTREHPKRRGELEFCAHHYRANLPELLGDGWAVAVQTELVESQ